MPPPNADLRNGVAFSAERLVPLVTVHDSDRKVVLCDASGGACSFYDPPSDLTFGFESGALRSLQDLPGVAFDGAIHGFTLGTSARVGATGGKNVDDETNPGFIRTKTAFALMPRVGYVVPLGDSFALWPRLGLVLLTDDRRTPDFELPFATVDVATVFFFARHAALTLTPSAQLPLSQIYDRRFGVDGGLLLAF